MLIANNDIRPARGAIQALKQYRHPGSQHGVGQKLAVKLLLLDRHLRKQEEEVQAAVRDLIKEHGEEQIPGNPDSKAMKKGMKGLPSFNLAVQELGKVEFEVPDRMCLNIKELVVRDEDGERAPVEIGEIADLGPLLILEEDSASEDGEEPAPAKKPARKRKGA